MVLLILSGDTGDGGQLLLVGPVGPDQAHLGPLRQSVSAAMHICTLLYRAEEGCMGFTSTALCTLYGGFTRTFIHFLAGNKSDSVTYFTPVPAL